MDAIAIIVPKLMRFSKVRFYDDAIMKNEETTRKFAIRKIVVHSACHERMLKILKPDEYVFSDSKFDEFFLDGVTVCSVVGKNGCGKSSLIELLFRMINNLGAMMLKNLDRPAAETLYLIEGVVADLYFKLDDKDGLLSCDTKTISLVHDNHSFVWDIKDGKCVYKVYDTVQENDDLHVAWNIANHFFYLIATNYSMQAYVDTDYRFDSICSWQEKKDVHGEQLIGNEWRKDETGSWINSVFHKNDGYMCPIVLNPYRDGGVIDMGKEAHLTTNRLCALLQQTKDDFQLIEGYRLAYIEYKFNQLYLLKKFDRKVLRDIPVESVSEKFFYAYIQDNSYAKAILDGYGIDATNSMNYIELSLRLYLVYKTFSIANKYPQYSQFKPLGNVNNAFSNTTNKQELELVKDLARSIKSKGTHIELKVHQTLDLIHRIDNLNDKSVLEKPLKYEELCDILGINTKCESVLERFNMLPSPLFAPTIYLIKDKVYKRIMNAVHSESHRKILIEKKAIQLSQLSSGERQFIYTTSTLIYHAFNILSIPRNERVAYRNLCFVLEEVEICFHPEYQRTFVNKLLSLLARMELNKAFGICVIIVTHSPFVLSDMPKGNILYLDEGKNVTEEKHLNTFGANVNELLCQSFFLSDGFMGEFAQQRIKSLVDYLKGDDDPYWNETKAKETIDIVGDEVIQYQLRQLYAIRFKDSMNYRNWIVNEARKLGLKV